MGKGGEQQRDKKGKGENWERNGDFFFPWERTYNRTRCTCTFIHTYMVKYSHNILMGSFTLKLCVIRLRRLSFRAVSLYPISLSR